MRQEEVGSTGQAHSRSAAQEQWERRAGGQEQQHMAGTASYGCVTLSCTYTHTNTRFQTCTGACERPCTLPLHPAPAPCPYTLPLHPASAPCPCTLPTPTRHQVRQQLCIRRRGARARVQQSGCRHRLPQAAHRGFRQLHGRDVVDGERRDAAILRRVHAAHARQQLAHQVRLRQSGARGPRGALGGARTRLRASHTAPSRSWERVLMCM